MLLDTELTEVIVDGDFKKTGFRIEEEETSHVIALISSKLYSNKSKAAQQELISNAYDSHVMAGKADVPFEISLPNYLSPFFKIVDSGVSMTDEEVRNIYGRVGFSTKKKSNEQVGCFGIGKLAVLGVTDSYTLICGKNGIKNTYSVYKDETNRPQIALLGTESTDWIGVEISFPVKQEEFNNFKIYLQEILQFYKVRPIVNSNPPFIFIKNTYNLEGQGWGIPDNSTRALAIMGQSAYPIDFASLQLSREEGQALELKPHLFFDIGQLAITPTRESLSYTQEVKVLISEKLKDIVEIIRKEFKEEMSKLTNLIEAKKLYCDLQYGLTKFSNYKGLIGPIDFKGHVVSDYSIPFHKPLEGEIISINEIVKRVRPKLRQVNKIFCNKSIVFLEDDLPEGINKKLSSRLLTILDNVSYNVDIYIFSFRSPEDKEKVLKEYSIENVEFRKLSTIEPKKRTRAANGTAQRNPKHQAKVFSFKDSTYTDDTYWEVEDIEIDDGGVYVVIDRFRPIIDSIDRDPDFLVAPLSFIKDLGLDIDFYGIKRSFYEKNNLAANPNWIELSSYIKTEVIKEIEKSGLPQKEADRLYALPRQVSWAKTITPNDFFTTNLVKEFLEKNKEMLNEKDVLDINKLHLFLMKFSIRVDRTSSFNLDELLKKVYKRYPLLAYLTETPKEALLHYIESIEKIS